MDILTPMSAEQFISDIPPAEQIVLALRHIGVELFLDEEAGIKAIGKTSRIDPALRKRIASSARLPTTSRSRPHWPRS